MSSVNKHSPFGGSVAARVLRCPASVGLVAKVPEHLRRPSAYADRGTALHTAMARLIDETKSLDESLIGTTIGSYTVTDDDVENALRPTYTYVAALLDTGAEFFLEHRVTFPNIADTFGTADLIVRVGDTVHVIDFKFGVGVRVLALHADGDQDVLNAQLMFYAAAARDSLPKFFAGVTKIVLTILQPVSIEPDAEMISTVEVSHAELDQFIAAYYAACSKALSTARFNARLADALVTVVNEAVAEDGEQQAQRRLHYDALKNTVEPSPTARRRFEAKGQHAYAQKSAASVMIATNHRDVVKLPWRDRRFSVITCGMRMTKEETEKIRAWMAVPENIGALYRALLDAPAVPAAEFDPFGEPPPFKGRLEMISMGKSRLEDAYEAAIDALTGCPLFTMTQAQRLINYIGAYTMGDNGSDKARHTVAKNAYRLRERDEADNRIKYRKRQEVVYARTKIERERWRKVETQMITAALDRAEERVTQVINAERDVLAEFLRARNPDSPPDRED
jgi:hypothetical protein